MTLGERIQNLRKQSNLSQEELAEKVDVSKQSVSKWELDKSVPNVEKLLILCDIFNVSADYLLRGKENKVLVEQEPLPKQEENEPESIAEEQANGNDNKKQIKYSIGLAFSFIVTVIMCIVVYKVVIFNNLGIKDYANQDLVYVDRIYNQYTKADIVYYNEDNEFITKTVFLDNKGLSEGDWIFCYPDAGKNDVVRFPYSVDTCIILIVLLIVCIGISVILTILFLKNAKGSKKSKSKVMASIVLMCLVFAGICGKDRVQADTAEESSETEADSTEGETQETYEDDLQLIRKETGKLSVLEECVTFSVPEGLYSSGVSEYEDSSFEIYYNEDMFQSYTVYVSAVEPYDTLDEYIRDRYSEEEMILGEGGEISMPQEEIIGDNTVKYITVSESYKDELYQTVYAGVMLPSGAIFEVEASTMAYEGDLYLEKVRPFFENLQITQKKEG